MYEESSKEKRRGKKKKSYKKRLFIFVILVSMFLLRDKFYTIYLGLFLMVAMWTLFGLTNPRAALPWLPEEKRTRGRLFIRGLLSAVFLIFLIISTSIPSTPVDYIKAKGIVTPSIEEKSLSTEDGIVITLPGMALIEEKELVISETNVAPEISKDINNVLSSYEITLEDIKSFDGHLTVDIPYEKSNLLSEDPKESLEALYFDEENSAWEPIMTEVFDTHVRLYMDHLTKISLVESNRKKARPVLIGDPNQEILDKARSLPELNEKTAAEKLEIIGWSQALNTYGIAGSGTTLMEEVLEFTKLNKTNNIMKNLGVITTLVQVTADLNAGDYESASMSSTKGFMSYAIAQWGSKALNVAGVGMFMIDYSLNRLGEEAVALREGMLSDIYSQYYQQQSRTYTDWYNIIWRIATTSQSEDEMKNLIEQEINEYVTLIWRDEGAVAELQAEIQGHGWTFEAGFKEEQKRELENEFRLQLIHQLQPVFRTVEKNLRMRVIKDKVWAEQTALNYLDSYVIIRAKMTGGTPGATIKSELLNDGNVVAIGEMYTLDNPYTGNTVAKFELKVIDFISSGTPADIRITMINPDGSKISKTEQITFNYTNDGFVQIAFDAPKLPDEEYIEEDQGIADDQQDSDIESSEGAGGDNTTTPTDDQISKPATEKEQALEILNAWDNVRLHSYYQLREHNEAAYLEFQELYDKLYQVASKYIDTSEYTGIWKEDYYFDKDEEFWMPTKGNGLEYDIYMYYVELTKDWDEDAFEGLE
ncbi:MAG: hypothetical protein R6U59_00865 [Eubacteriales bacterium]